MWEQFYERFLTPLDDPGSRLFHLNIIAAVILAIFVGRKASWTSIRRTFFRVRYWWNRSTRIDYQIYALNSVLKVLLFIPFLDFGFRFSQWTVRGLLNLNGGEFGGFNPSFLGLLAMTVFSFVFDDFLRFFHHWLMHKVSWLWPYHSVHHSARVLTPITLYRTHPVEAAMAAVRNSISLGVSTGVFIFLFESRFTLVTFFGVNLFGQLFNFLGSNLRHSHVPLTFGIFERVFISPKQHQIHHSRALEDRDKNFGVSLSVWDAMFGSLVLSRERSRSLSFGVDGAFESRLMTIVSSPFAASITSLSTQLQKTSKRTRELFAESRVARTLFAIQPHQPPTGETSEMKRSILGLFSVLFATGLATQAHADLTIYTDRPTVRVQSIADEFTKATGEKVVIIEEAYGKLLTRLKTEGSASPADIIFVKDLVYLAELSNLGWFQPMNSSVVDQEISPQMRDPKSLWTAVTVRGRTIVYDASRVQASELKGYEDLAHEKWAGRLCLRTGASAYNEALVAGLIEVHGKAKATEIIDGWVQNLAVDPIAGDTGVLEAIANGVCDVGITNTYYLGQMLAKNPAFPVKAYFADQASTGVFGNGTGAGVAVTSKQKALATKFIELMLTDKFQLEMSSSHFDYPAKQGLLPSTLVKEWGTFKYNDANWTAVGSRAEEARELIKTVGYR